MITMMKLSFIYRSIFVSILFTLSISSCNSQHTFQFTHRLPSITRSRSTIVNFVHRTPKQITSNVQNNAQLRKVPLLRSSSVSTPIDSRSFSFGRSECTVGTCQFYYNCSRKTSSPPKFCSMTNGFTGVCCHNNNNNNGDKVGISLPQTSRFPVVTNTFSPTIVAESSTRNVNLADFNSNEANQIIKDLVSLEDELRRNDLEPKSGTQEFSHQNFFGGNQLSLKEMNDAIQALETFISFAKRLVVIFFFFRLKFHILIVLFFSDSQNMSLDDIQSSNMNIRDVSSLAGICESNAVCQNIRYRNPDGTCNNLIYTNQGKAVSTFSRLLSPDYGDRFNEPRRAMDGNELPNSRQISMSISPESQLENDFYSTMLMQFGQFIDHDITRTAITRSKYLMMA